MFEPETVYGIQRRNLVLETPEGIGAEGGDRHQVPVVGGQGSSQKLEKSFPGPRRS